MVKQPALDHSVDQLESVLTTANLPVINFQQIYCDTPEVDRQLLSKDQSTG